jgi:glycosyltransferase involved in cell wall biosynthesis
LIYTVLTSLTIIRVGELTGEYVSDDINYPKVSVIVAASNEENGLEAATESKLNSDYPDFEIIIVDDRSSDSTPEIIERLKKRNPNLKNVRIDELPDGWMGKQNALNEGVKHANGELLLFTDADVFYSPDAVKAAVAHLESNGLDQLGVAASLWGDNFLLNAMFNLFVRTYMVSGRLWAVGWTKFRPFTGIGGFNLVRRSAFERTEGFDWLKMDLADDVALGIMIAKHGGKCGVLGAGDYMTVNWYGSLREMINGLERGSYATHGGYSVITGFLSAAIFFVVELAPVLLMAIGPTPEFRMAGMLLLIMAISVNVAMSKWGHGSIWVGLVYPVCVAIMAYILVRGAWVGYRRGGIIWRDTFYSKEELKKGQRIRIP